jgi:hypothetical protein
LGHVDGDAVGVVDGQFVDAIQAAVNDTGEAHLWVVWAMHTRVSQAQA